MKAIYVADITADSQVASEFFVLRKSLMRARNGAAYLSLTLSDRTGQIEARLWEEAEKLSALFAEGDFVRVRARGESYRDAVQLNVAAIERVEAAALNLADFLPSSERDPQEMLRELKALCRKIGDPHLLALVLAFFADRPLMEVFAKAPAAKNMHHAYIGGLVEHTLSVARLSLAAAAHYPEIDGDLLLAAALLHDLGKVRELSCAPGFDYTPEGRLIGHLLLGVEMLEEKLARLPGFPPEVATALKHLIISHHGEYEFGSPKRPKTAEAFVLHALDDLDAKMAAVRQLLRSAGPAEATYHRVLERYIFGPLTGKAALRDGEPEAGQGADDANEANYSLLQPLLKG
jgi:3'-5' exoribonuclease